MQPSLEARTRYSPQATALRGQGLSTAFSQVRDSVDPRAPATLAQIGHSPDHGYEVLAVRLVVSFGNSGTCHGADYSWRVDTLNSSEFIQQFLG